MRFSDRYKTVPGRRPSGELPPTKDADPRWRRGAILSRAEAEWALSCPQLPPDRTVLYGLALYAGARFGEYAGLLWRDYDPHRQPLGCLHIDAQYDGAGLKVDGLSREVPVDPALAAILAEWRSHGWTAMFGRKPTERDFIVPRRSDLKCRTQSPAWRD